MMDLLPELAVLSRVGQYQAPEVNPNLLDRLNNSTSVLSGRVFDSLPVNSGLACVCNRQIDPLVKSSSKFFTQCFEAQQDSQDATAITESYWEYNATNSATENLVIGNSAHFRYDVPWASKIPSYAAIMVE